MKIDKKELEHLLLNGKWRYKDLANYFGVTIQAVKQSVMRNDALKTAKKFSQSIGKSSRFWNEYKGDDIYYVYYLPEHHYIGVTNNPSHRMKNHRINGKLTEGFELLLAFKNPRLAAWYEATFRLMGYEGSAYVNMVDGQKTRRNEKQI